MGKIKSAILALAVSLTIVGTVSCYAAKRVVESATTFRAVPDSTLLHRPFGKADEKMFLSPARIFYPETWFHFVNGNVSREGITRDLEAIAQSGIQGVQLFHGRMNDDVWPGTEEPTECLTPKWEDLVRHTATEAHRQGMRFNLQTCPEWAMSGGPRIKSEQAMRHLIYTRTDVEGGKPVDAILPIDAKEDWRNWQDICVLAFPTPLGDTGHYREVEEVRADDHQQEWERLLKEGKNFVMPPTQPGKPYRYTIKLKKRRGEGTGVGLPLTELQTWKDLPLSDERKAFSGTATYKTTFLPDHKPKKEGGRVLLNLGKVEEIAVVSVRARTN